MNIPILPSKRELNEKITELFEIPINNTKEYLKNENDKAISLRKNINVLDREITTDLIKLDANFPFSSNILEDFNELKEELRIVSDEDKNEMSEAISEFQDQNMKQGKDYVYLISLIIRDIKKVKEEIRDSTLNHALELAYSNLKTSLEKESNIAKNKIKPQLDAVVKEYDEADQAFRKELDKNPFDQILEALPEKIVLPEKDKPAEVAAAENAYNLLKSGINLLGDIYTMDKYTKKREQIKNRKDIMQKLYDSEINKMNEIKEQMANVSRLHRIDNVRDYYLNLGDQLVDYISDIYNNLSSNIKKYENKKIEGKDEVFSKFIEEMITFKEFINTVGFVQR
ncbi:MAG: hypothetical protein LBM26_00915 [Methanobrevibacter sp.]|jgi:translation initiation factor 2B subunit (eIF-2B alpha/beta/delta family)|nr:hypothetical protein [Methanobrevibacter sp.]